MKLMDVFTIITGTSSFLGISALSVIKFVIDKTKHIKLIKQKTHIKTATITMCCAFGLSLLISWEPWNKFHYGYQKKIIHDTIRLTVRKPLEEPIKSPSNDQIKKPKQFKIINYKAKKIKADTSKKSLMPTSNGVVSTGANAHIVAGTGNNVEVNGDVINEPLLTEAVKADLINRIEKKKKEFGIYNNIIGVLTSSSSNAGKLVSQIIEFLPTKGYIIGAVGMFTGTEKGIGIYKGSTGNITLYIGVVDTK